MIKTRSFPLFVFVSLMAWECVESYDAKSIKYEKVVVVEALLTDQQRPHSVSLNYSTPIDTSYDNPITNAEVWIEDSNGNREVYKEETRGRYISSVDFHGIPGEAYSLHFITAEGKSYTSSAETLIPSPETDSIYGQFAVQPDADLNRNVPGIQFFVDTHDPSGAARSYRYEWNDTYQLIPEYPSRFEFEIEIEPQDTFFLENEMIIIPPDTVTYLYRRVNKVFPCYRSRTSEELILGTTANSTQSALREQPIVFISQFEPVLRNRYSIEVTQYALTEKAFNYYRQLRESIVSVGSLFDKQKGSIVGNVNNEQDPLETVLGFFEVSGVKKKRVFFKSGQFDERFHTPDNFYECDIFQDALTMVNGLDFPVWAYVDPHLNPNDDNSDQYYVMNVDWEADYPYIFLRDGIEMLKVDIGHGIFTHDLLNLAIVPWKCASCHWYGTTEPPAFWPEDEMY